jgi:hypothetical protein
MSTPRTQCPVCAGTGRPGVVGTEKVTFEPRKVFGMPAPTMAPLVDSVGGMPYVGTGLRLRRAAPATGAFCADHVVEARRLAGDGLSLPAALRQMVHDRA